MNDTIERELVPGTPNLVLAVWLMVATGYVMFAINTIADQFRQ